MLERQREERLPRLACELLGKERPNMKETVARFPTTAARHDAVLTEIRAICIQARTTCRGEGPLPAEAALQRIIDLVFPEPPDIVVRRVKRTRWRDPDQPPIPVPKAMMRP